MDLQVIWENLYIHQLINFPHTVVIRPEDTLTSTIFVCKVRKNLFYLNLKVDYYLNNNVKSSIKDTVSDHKYASRFSQKHQWSFSSDRSPQTLRDDGSFV